MWANEVPVYSVQDSLLSRRKTFWSSESSSSSEGSSSSDDICLPILDELQGEDMKFYRNPHPVRFDPFEFNFVENIGEDGDDYLRFTPHEFHELAGVLGLPNDIRLYNSSKSGIVPSHMALAAYLAELAYPRTYRDLTRHNRFGRDTSTICRAVNWMTRYMDPHATRCLRLDRPVFVRRMQYYADCAVEKGTAVANCIGYIDSSFCKSMRPGNGAQGGVYNSYYGHGIKTLTANMHDGLHGFAWGPESVRHADSSLVEISDLEDQMYHFAWDPIARKWRWRLFGDDAFPFKPWLWKGFSHLAAPEWKRKFSRTMNKFRVSVENTYCMTKNAWKTVEYFRKLKLTSGESKNYFMQACLLHNIRCCLKQGNQVAKFFKCPPPRLEEYWSDD